MRALMLSVIFALVAAGCGSAGPDPSSRRPLVQRADTIWLIFIDDLHLDFRNTGYLRGLLKTISTDLIRNGDMFAVASSGPSNLSIRPTVDHGLLETAIRRASGAGLAPVDIVEILSRRKEPNEIGFRANVALSAARRLIASVERARSRRKALIYISNGYRLEPGARGIKSSDTRSARQREMTAETVRRQFSELTREAKRARVRVFAIDQRSLRTPDPDADLATWDGYLAATRKNSRILCERTGGLTLSDSRNHSETVKRISSALR